jgi:hypothetical protein
MGRSLLLLSSLSGVSEVKAMAIKLGYDVEDVAEERHFFEQLHILKIGFKKKDL